MGKIIFDYGHGGKDSGASFNGRLEKVDNLKLGQDVRKVLLGYGLTVDETRSKDIDLSLQERCNIANKKEYSLFVSFHRNAYKPNQANGVETFVYINQKDAKTIQVATDINNAISKVGFRNRGVKRGNFKVLRETKPKAVLIETGFIDNTKDNKLFDSKYKDIVEGISHAILKYMNIPIDDIKNGVFYRVVTGSFNSRKNAVERVEQLKMKGFESFIDIYRG